MNTATTATVTTPVTAIFVASHRLRVRWGSAGQQRRTPERPNDSRHPDGRLAPGTGAMRATTSAHTPQCRRSRFFDCGWCRHVREPQVFETDFRHRSRRVKHRLRRADEQGGLPVGVALLDHRLIRGQAGRVASPRGGSRTRLRLAFVARHRRRPALRVLMTGTAGLEPRLNAPARLCSA